jgi:hypothetical protein
LLAVLTVPRTTQRGMFGDGLMYATISRNLSIGVGSFWAPTRPLSERLDHVGQSSNRKIPVATWIPRGPRSESDRSQSTAR